MKLQLKAAFIISLTCFSCTKKTIIKRTGSSISIITTMTNGVYSASSLYFQLHNADKGSFYLKKIGTDETVLSDDYSATVNGTTKSIFSSFSKLEMYIQPEIKAITYPTPPLQDTLTTYVFGDSIAWGAKADSNLNGWCYLLMRHFGQHIINNSVIGTQITAMDEKLIPNFNSKKCGWLFIAYGTNDRNNDPIVERNTFISKINAVLAKGWPTSRIIINSGYFCTNPTYFTPEYLKIVEVEKNVGLLYGIQTVNNIAPMKAAQDSVNQIYPDKIHPNDAGHHTIYNNYLRVLKYTGSRAN